MKRLPSLFLVIIFLLISTSSSFAIQQENEGQTLSGKVKVPMMACIEKEDYKQIYQLMLIEKDYDAASELTSHGRCVLLKDGEKVSIKDAGLSNFKIRRKGSSKTYWIGKEFIE